MEDQILIQNSFKNRYLLQNKNNLNNFAKFPEKSLKFILSIVNNKWALIICYP